MKTIMIATDGSAVAGNAFRYGLSLAKALQARVVLLHVFRRPSSFIPDLDHFCDEEEIADAIILRLQQQAIAWAGEDTGRVEVAAVAGDPAEMIADQAVAHGCELIVAGMRGGHRLARHLFGSTVTALLKKTRVALLVIPEDWPYRPVANIVLANDIIPQGNVYDLDALEQLTRHFKATIHIVRVVNDAFAEAFENRHPALKYTQLHQSGRTHYEYCKENNIVDALNKTVDLHKADILVVVPHKHLLIEKIFFKSISQSAVEKAQCPVLVLPEGPATELR